MTAGSIVEPVSPARRIFAWTRNALQRVPPLLLILFAIALIGPLFVRDPLELSAGPRLGPPSLDFWFGTDQFGMDIFARVVHAARLDLGVGIGAALIAVAIGMPLGALAAFRGGAFDTLLLRVAESLQAFPTLLLALGIVASLGSSIPNLVFVIALVNIPVYLRLTRSAVLPIIDSEYVLAARCAGKGDFAILGRHILPNVSQVLLAQFSVNVAWAIQILAALSFIGLGVSLPTAEWGAMVRGGADYTTYGQWWVAVFPGLAIVATVLILNSVADRVRPGR
jgi:peptide/nickel transport system permease protein